MRNSPVLKFFGILLLVVAAALTQGQSAFAHHSFGPLYFMGKRIKVAGTVTEVKWVNPHSYFFLDVKNDDGTVTQWEFQLHAPNDMTRRKQPRNSIKPGDVVTVRAVPARGGVPRGFTATVTTPDGRKVMDTGIDEWDKER